MYSQNGLYNSDEFPRNSDSNAVILFLPREISNLKNSRGYLYGDFEVNESFVKIFYILKTNDVESDNCLGVCSNNFKKNASRIEVNSHPNWIDLEINNNLPTLRKLKLDGEVQDIPSQQIILLYYDRNSIMKVDMLKNDSFAQEDYFKNLAKKLHSSRNVEKISNFEICDKVLCPIRIWFKFFNMLHRLLKAASKYSNIALQIENYLQELMWIFKTLWNDKSVNIKVVNILLSMALDMLLGILFLNWLTSRVSLDSFPNIFFLTAENVVSSLKELITWLTGGDPAGLKLNLAFNKMLATFFLFHIDIWWTFLTTLKPGLKFAFLVFLYLGQLGVTFQASITADLLGLVSFHVYCIYAYAARLYNIQISALIALWRLFLGRKKNPLRKKVDSCRYSPEQLFVGTIAFTILLFLLPTTLVYYIIFTFIRVLTVMYIGILTRVRWLLHSLPIYSTFLWLIRSTRISGNIQLIPEKSSLKSNFIVLTLKPNPESWWKTVQRFQPDCITKPSPFNLADFCSGLITGKLIYPVDFSYPAKAEKLKEL